MQKNTKILLFLLEFIPTALSIRPYYILYNGALPLNDIYILM